VFELMIEKTFIIIFPNEKLLILFFSLILIGLVISALFILYTNKILYNCWCSSSFITKSYFPCLFEIRGPI